MIGAPGWLDALVLTAAVVAYYGFAVRLVGEPLARRFIMVLTERTAVARQRTWADVDGVVRLVLAGLMQAGFAFTLIMVTAVSPSDFLSEPLDIRVMLLGVLLGVAEAGFATQVGLIGSRFAELLRPGQTPTTIEGWLSVSRGGWIRYYLRTAEAAPVWLLIAATVLYVTGEEIVFRGIAISILGTFSAPFAVGVSTALFVLVQAFYTPGWKTALFPMLGAAVVGIVHSILFIIYPNVLPLAVAHATMFLITVL